jgi:hypothetical protein
MKWDWNVSLTWTLAPMAVDHILHLPRLFVPSTQGRSWLQSGVAHPRQSIPTGWRIGFARPAGRASSGGQPVLLDRHLLSWKAEHRKTPQDQSDTWRE